MIRRTIATLIAALAVGLGGAVAVSTPAHAAWSDCPNGNTCFFDGTNGTGDFYASIATGFPDGTCKTLPVANRNRATSLYNRAANTLIFYYPDPSCGGGAVTFLFTGEAKGDLRGTGYNNDIESFRIYHA